MRLVLDTNTALSALLWGGTPGRLIDAAEAGLVELASSAALLAELQGVLTREKFSRQLARRGFSVADIFDGYAALVTIVAPAAIPSIVTRDPADDQVLAAAQADLIVSGDAHLLELETFQSSGGGRSRWTVPGRRDTDHRELQVNEECRLASSRSSIGCTTRAAIPRPARPAAREPHVLRRPRDHDRRLCHHRLGLAPPAAQSGSGGLSEREGLVRRDDGAAGRGLRVRGAVAAGVGRCGPSRVSKGFDCGARVIR